jgi:hypothetical protein
LPSATATYRASQILLSISDVFSASASGPPMHTQSRSRTACLNSGNTGSVATAAAGTSSGGSGPSTAGGAGIGSSASSIGSGVSGKFVPVCSVRTIRDLAIEMKASSSQAQAAQFNMRSVTSKLSILEELNAKLRPNTDKAEFKKQMDSSRVLGKEVRVHDCHGCSCANVDASVFCL